MNTGIDYWPGTNIVKSRNNGFTQGLRLSDNEWRGITAAAALKAASTSQVERSRRDLGVDPGAFYGISKKSDDLVRHGGAFTRAAARPKPQGESMSARIRWLLKDGPKDSRELGELMGLTSRHVRGLLQWDVDHGKVKKVPGDGLTRYALPEHA
jgi:hypothetical protein